MSESKPYKVNEESNDNILFFLQGYFEVKNKYFLYWVQIYNLYKLLPCHLQICYRQLYIPCDLFITLMI